MTRLARKRIWQVAPIAIVLLIAVALVLIGRPGSPAAGDGREARHVDAGGRRLFVRCRGEPAGPLVLLIAGGGFSSEVWNLVQDSLPATVRVCSFDRAGVGRSDSSIRAQTADEIVADIAVISSQAHGQSPFILVGHSVGGIHARMYAARFPDRVAGLVLVDSAHEEQIWRLAGIAPAVLDAEFGAGWRDPAARRDLGFLGDGETLEWNTRAPLIVLQQGKPLPERPELGLTAAVIPRVTASWQALQEDLAARSPLGELRTARRSGHFIQRDEPALVARAIEDVIARSVR